MRFLATTALAATIVLAGAVIPANADILPPGGGTVTAPAADGTNGANDIAPVQVIRTVSPRAITSCDPNSIRYTASGVIKSGAVTNWGMHTKNDATLETFTFSTINTATVRATVKVTGQLSASAALKKIAQVGLGLTSGYGLTGQYASSKSYSRSVSFSTAGTWIIWAGVYTGSGSVQMKKCSSDGKSLRTVGTGTAFTYKNATATGLTNCANSVNGLVAVNAKKLC
jgi:hypothetical protein